MTEYTFQTSQRGTKRALTIIPLGFDRRHVRIETSKRNAGVLSTTANVCQDSEDGLSFSYVLFRDYSATVAKNSETRATEKAIRTMHEAALRDVDTIVANAKAHYQPKDVALSSEAFARPDAREALAKAGAS